MFPIRGNPCSFREAFSRADIPNTPCCASTSSSHRCVCGHRWAMMMKTRAITTRRLGTSGPTSPQRATASPVETTPVGQCPTVEGFGTCSLPNHTSAQRAKALITPEVSSPLSVFRLYLFCIPQSCYRAGFLLKKRFTVVR